MTFAGLNAFSIRNAGLSSQLMISIFSPRSSLTIALTRAPFKPTHAPTGSTFGSLELTAIFVLEPASRAIALDLNGTVADLGNLSLKQAFYQIRMGSGYGDTRSLRACLFTSRIYTLIRSVGLNTSPFTCSLSVQDRVDLAEVDADVASYIALYDTRYDIFLLAVPLLIQGVAALPHEASVR